MSIGKTSSKSSTTGATDPSVQSAYQSLLGQAQQTASTPYQGYTGQLVAPLNDTENQAISQIQGAGGLAAPYLTQAAQYAQAGATPITTTPFSQQAVDQYMSPYQNDVINSQVALENQQDAQQQQSLAGNITAAGAWGGDRSAVLQSQLGGQQTLANNSTNANLENQGYQSALGQFNTANTLGVQTQQANNQNNQATGYELGSLGNSLQTNALNSANSLLSAGSLAQNTSQNADTAAYQQYQQQLAYPYQNEQFLASLLPGITQGTGTTTNSSSTQPFNYGSLVGLGNAYARGGRTKLASGGMPLSGSPMFISPPNLQSYVPAPQGGMSLSQGNQGGGTASGGSNYGGQGGSQNGSLQSFMWGNPQSDTADASSGLFGSGGQKATMAQWGDDLSKGISSGLGFLDFLQKGGRTHLADGGADDAAAFDAILDQEYPGDGSLAAVPAAPAPQGPSGASAMSLQDTPPQWRDQATNFAPDASGGLQDQSGSAAPTWDDGTPVATADGGQGGGLSSSSGKVLWQAPDTPTDWGHVLLSGLAGFASSGNLGKGLAAGMKDYDDQMDPHPEVDHSGASVMIRYGAPGQRGQLIDTGIPTEAALNAKAMNSYRMANMDTVNQTRQAAIAERAQAAQDAVAQRSAAASEAAANRAAQLRIAAMTADQGHYQWQPGTQNDPKTGQPVSGMWRLPTRGGEAPQFVPGDAITGKASAGGAGSGLSGREGVFFNRVTQAGNAATAAMSNIMELPITIDRGILGGRSQGPSLLDAGKEDLANAVTPEDAQGYNVMLAGVSRNLSAIEASGLAPNGSLTHSMDSLTIKPGDTQDTKLRKMAEMRQIVETGLEPNLSNPRLPPEQKALVQKIITQAKTAVPFTQHDITALQSSKNPQASIRDVMQKKGLGGGGGGAQFHEGQVLHQGGNLFKVVNGTPVYQGPAQ